MKDLKKEILRYIQNEKDVSRYQISILEKFQKLSLSKKRILNLEKEFLLLPLEDMNFEDVADVAAAISIYKSSRNLFYQTYKIPPPEEYSFNKTKYLNYLKTKLDFIRNSGLELISNRVQEINLVQNSAFYYELAQRQAFKNGTSIELEKRNLDNLDLVALLLLEPLTIAKKRARAQATIYSIGKYLLESSSNYIIDESLNLESLKDLNQKLDEIIKNLKYNVFKHYNVALKVLPEQLKGTMGENSYLSKIHPLQNVLDFSSLKKFGIAPTPISNPQGFNKNIPMIGNIFFGSKKIISTSVLKDSEKNIQNKVFGILLPIPRKGNEKMTLLYKNIMVDGLDVSHLFADNISNTKALRGVKEAYFKSLLMQPLWKIINLSLTDSVARYVLTILTGYNQQKYQDLNFNNDVVISALNNLHSGFFKIAENSMALTAKTRSEDEGLAEIFPIINSKISELTEDYNRLITNEMF